MATKTAVTTYNNVADDLRTGMFVRLTVPYRGIQSLNTQHKNHLKKTRVLCYYDGKLYWKDKKKMIRAWGSAPEWWQCTPNEWTALTVTTCQTGPATIQFWKENGRAYRGLQNMKLGLRGANHVTSSGLYLKLRKLKRDTLRQVLSGARKINGVSDRTLRAWRKKLRLNPQPSYSVLRSPSIIAILRECRIDAGKGLSTREAAKIFTATTGKKCSHQTIHRIRQSELASSCNHKNCHQCQNALVAAVIQECL